MVMKKIFVLGLVIAFASCHSNSGENDSNQDSALKTNGVQNVNGNIPDTSNSTDITGKSKIDSSKIDSSNLKGDSLTHKK